MNSFFRLPAVLLAFLSVVTASAWESVDFGNAVRQAQSENKDILVVYTANRMGEAGKRWDRALLNNPAVSRGLENRFILSRLALPSKANGRTIAEIQALRLASIHGIGLLPTMVLCDREGKAYARIFGGIKTDQDALGLVDRLNKSCERKLERDTAFEAAKKTSGKEKEKWLLKGLETVPVSAWSSDYPEIMRQLATLGSRAVEYQKALQAEEKRKRDEKLSSLMLRASVCPNLADADRLLNDMQGILNTPDLDVETKQFILLNGTYPLLVKKAGFHHNGTANMALEQAFDESVKTLEKVRDMNPSSYWGREAHRIREELRRARLSAARYD